MFDISWFEIMVVAVVALVIIGPKDLPRTLRNIAQWVRQGRRMMSQFRSGIDDMMREAELDELRQQADKLQNYDIKDEAGRMIDPTGDVRRDVEDAVREAEQEAAADAPAIEKPAGTADAEIEPALAEAGVMPATESSDGAVGEAAKKEPKAGASPAGKTGDGAKAAAGKSSKSGGTAKAKTAKSSKGRAASKARAGTKTDGPAETGGERG